MTEAEIKIQMLKRSMRCFALGLLAALPVLGFAFGILALIAGGQARAAEKNYWNAARPYRIFGTIAAAISVIFWSFIIILIIGHNLGLF
jgi:hypothetical protein